MVTSEYNHATRLTSVLHGKKVGSVKKDESLMLTSNREKSLQIVPQCKPFIHPQEGGVLELSLSRATDAIFGAA